MRRIILFLLIVMSIFLHRAIINAVEITQFFSDLYIAQGVMNNAYPDATYDYRLRIEQVVGASYSIQVRRKLKSESWAEDVVSNSWSGSLDVNDGTSIVLDYNYNALYTSVNADYNTSPLRMHIYEDFVLVSISAYDAWDIYFPASYVFIGPPCVGVFGNPPAGYSAAAVNIGTGNVVQFSTNELQGLCLSWEVPTPTPGVFPTPSPTPSPLSSLLPSPDPSYFPVFTVVPTVVAEVEGNFTYDETTGQGTITVKIYQDVEYVELDDEVYELGTGTVSSEIPLPEGGSTSDTESALEEYLSTGSSTVNSVAGDWFQPIVNSVMDMILNHPFMSYFSEIEFEVTDPVCSFTIELFGETLEFGFCELEDEFAILRLVIIGVAGVYSFFIVIKGD